MLVQRAHIYRLSPTVGQAATLAQWAGTCRYVYNLALEQRRDWWRPGRRFSYRQQAAELTELRSEADWIQAVPVHALQYALRAVDVAFQNFWLGTTAYPKPHRKFVHDSVKLPAEDVRFTRLGKRCGAIRLPKIGSVKLRWHRPLGGILKSVTLKRKSGHWFAVLQWEREVENPSPSALPTVGVDRGVKLFAALSDGETIEPLNAFAKVSGRLAKAQQKLARKVKGGANWIEQKSKVTKLHTHAANMRKDFLHKHSLAIAKSHGVIKIEKLQVRTMSASAKGTIEAPGKNVAAKCGLNRSILDQGWSMFAAMLRYKLTERGGQLIEVDAAYTSQTCSECGCVDAASRKDQATFACVHCGHQDNADINAARNIARSVDYAHQPPKRTLRRVGKRKPSEEMVHVS
jgi:putative transposase